MKDNLAERQKAQCWEAWRVLNQPEAKTRSEQIRLAWRLASVLRKWSRRDSTYLLGYEAELEIIALHSHGDFRLFGTLERCGG